MHAVSTQTFSLPRDRLLPVELRSPDALGEIAARVEADPRFHVVDDGAAAPPMWHMGKLRKGELAGNHFSIVVSGTSVPAGEALERARAIAEALRTSGWANYYGPQRFGRAGADRAMRRGIELLTGRLSGDVRHRHAHHGWLGTLMLNSLQSALFNAYVAERIERGQFQAVYVGDLVAQPHSSAARPRMVRGGHGGESADGTLASQETAELHSFEISFTGPIFSGAMPKAGGAPAELEAEVWSRHVPSLPLASVKRSVLGGGRRVCRLPLPTDLVVEEAPEADGLRFEFSLPRGAYATSLLREFMHCEDADALGGEEESAEGAGDDADGAESAPVGPMVEIDVSSSGDVSSRGDVILSGDVSSSGDSANHYMPVAATMLRGLRVTSEPSHLETRALRELAAYLKQRSVRGRASGTQLEAGDAAAPPPHPLAVSPGSLGVQSLAAGRFKLLAFGASEADPVAVTLALLDDGLCAAEAMPTIARLLPVQATCAATLADVGEAVAPLLARTWPDGAKSFGVVWRVRRRGGSVPTGLERESVIAAIAERVRECVPDATVDLRAPDVSVRCEVFEEVASCALSVLPRWVQLDEYRLVRPNVVEAAAHAAAEEPPHAQDADM
mmetsp:Transcript_28531/g.91381  ORF Transcript_28531/g.91381 Transcript_28531/m.91381 type:complete len:616 (+) Transcript_28531:165-2012(+)